MRTEKERRIRIGDKIYSIVSDDDYLETINEDFEPDMARLFRCLVTTEDCVLDVGANIGCTSILLGDLSRNVISFEPSPSTFAYLDRNVRASGLTNISVQNYALGSQTGEAQISFSPNNRSGAFVANSTKGAIGHTRETIQIKRLDDAVLMLDLPRIEFIKIDVEGFEKYVIDGGKNTVAQSKPSVVLELNHWCLNAFQRISVPEFFDYLRSQFPILLAVEGDTYADLHNDDESYSVMYHHIIHFKYLNIVAGFDGGRFVRFRTLFAHKAL
jgi:FkbM family methyltransferase